jgi:hypothetical protein
MKINGWLAGCYTTYMLPFNSHQACKHQKKIVSVKTVTKEKKKEVVVFSCAGSLFYSSSGNNKNHLLFIIRLCGLT